MNEIQRIGPVAAVSDMPWDAGRPSIFSFVEAGIAAGEKDTDRDLPDRDVFFGDVGFVAVSGMIDAVSEGSSSEAPNPQALRSAFSAAVAGRPGGLAALYPLISKSGRTAAAAIMSDLPDDVARMPGRIADLGLLLLRNSPDREPVKFGMLILAAVPEAMTEGSRVRETLRTIASHEEFTLHALHVLCGGAVPDHRTVLEMAKGVRGWGRIHLVGLLEGTTDPEIREWLVREGFRNTIMDEYLAYVAADTGGLTDFLRGPRPDDALLDSAADILTALYRGGPERDITDWPAGVEASSLFLEHLEGRSPTFARLDAVLELVRHVRCMREEPAGPARWAPEDEDALEASAMAHLERPDVAGLIVSTIDGDADRSRDARFDVAVDVAGLVGIDVWESLLRRQETRPDEQWISRLADTRDPSRVVRLVDVVERIRNLETVPEGGIFGRDRIAYLFHQSFELPALLNTLASFPGTGRLVVSAGLRSRTPRCRKAAARALAAWGREAAGEELTALAWAVASGEGDEDVRERLSAFLGVPVPARTEPMS